MKSEISVIVPIHNNQNTLGATLRSLQEQSFRDFEVLLVDNGSEDESRQIIKEYCAADERFKDIGVDDNIGVSAARNIGLEKAIGKYIKFLDGDDILPYDSLKSMFKIMEKNKADLVVGKMLRRGTLQKSEIKNTKFLGNKKIIDKNNIDLIYSFSVCNKLFKKEIIKNNNIKFTDLTHAEDGVFLFSYLKHCEKICGCDQIVYEYYKPLPFLAYSATTGIKEGMLNDLISAFETIIKICKDKPEDYIREIYNRAIDPSLVKGYYRKLHRLDDHELSLLKKTIKEYRERITKEQWDNIVERNKDLMLEKGIMSKKEAEENSLITVAVTKKVSEKHRDKFMQSLYCQDSPFFRVIEEKENEPDFMKKALDNSTTPYITFIDHDIMYNDNTLRIMHKTLLKEGCDFVSGKMCGFHEGKKRDFPYLTIAFDAKGLKNKKRDILDWTFSNKLFVTEALKKCGTLDMGLIYKSLSHARKRNAIIITMLTEKQLMVGLQSFPLKERIEALTFYEQNRDKGTIRARIYENFKGVEKRVLLLCDEEEPGARSKILFDNIKSDKICLCKNMPEHKKQISKETKICSIILSEGHDNSCSNMPLREGQRLIAMADVIGENEEENIRFAELVDDMI